MDITFKTIETDDIEAFRILTEWYNDKVIRPLLIPNQSLGANDDSTAEDYMRRAQRNTHKLIYFILDQQQPIGVLTIDTKFQDLVKKKDESAWISMVIGDKTYWGKGVAQLAMQFLEEEAKRLGFTRIELGVYGFNQRAKAFYRKIFSNFRLKDSI